MKPNTLLLILQLITASFQATLSAQSPALPPPPSPSDIPQPGPQTENAYQPTPIVPGGVVVPLFPPNHPYLDQKRIREPEKYGSYSEPFLGYIVNIHNPSIEFHRASGAINTGTCVILAAGGGHHNLNVVGEGANIVPFLTSNGINAVILRNRLRSDGYQPKVDGFHDAHQAIKLVRGYADTWNLDPDKIGLIGFSAGAELAAATALYYENYDAENQNANNPLSGISSRPDFTGLIYPGPSPFAFKETAVIPRDAPPSFFASAGWGDWIHALWAVEYFDALLKDGVPNCEIHIYARGVHPGDSGQAEQAPATAGINARAGVAFGQWERSFLQWLNDLGFLEKAGTETLAARDTARNLNRSNPYETLQKRIQERSSNDEE